MLAFLQFLSAELMALLASTLEEDRRPRLQFLSWQRLSSTKIPRRDNVGDEPCAQIHLSLDVFEQLISSAKRIENYEIYGVSR